MEETFASYFLNQKDLERKFDIMHYLKKRTGIFYDTTVIFKTIMAKQFLNYLQDNYLEIELDENIIISARLLCDCMKKENSTDLEEIRGYAKNGAEYLFRLGFDKRFCRICEGVNRYTIPIDREIESDILELTDQFCGMVLDRPERVGFSIDEALVLLQYRNLRGKDNKFLDKFIEFANFMQKIEV